MSESKSKKPKVPYAPAGDIDALFERMTSIGDPGQITTTWVEQYSLAKSQPEGVVNLLRWLGVIDENGVSQGHWNKLRAKQTRDETLRELVLGSYRQVFDVISPEDLPNATPEDIHGAFVSSYGLGSTARYTRCFLKLCRMAGLIEEGDSDAGASERPTPRPTSAPQAKTPQQRVPSHEPQVGKERGNSNIGVMLAVEIPADWTEAQIAERVQAIRRSLEFE